MPRLGRAGGAAVAFLLFGLGLGAVLLWSTKLLYAAQGQVAGLATWLPVGYAYAAGMVAAVNPCGILLLPSLAAFALAQGQRDAATPRTRISRALTLGVVATAGFVVLFSAVGLVVGTGARAVVSWFPYGGLGVGLGLILLGAWLVLSGREMGVGAAGRVWERVRPGRGLASFFGFGVAYGTSSLACTLPVFLAVVGSTLSAGSVPEAAVQFVGYAVGMGTVLTAALVAVVLFEAAVMRWVRTVVVHVHRLAAAFLVAAGVFTVGYWWRAL